MGLTCTVSAPLDERPSRIGIEEGRQIASGKIRLWADHQVIRACIERGRLTEIRGSIAVIRSRARQHNVVGDKFVTQNQDPN